MIEKKTCSVAKAARMLGIGNDKAYQLIKTGVLPALKLGKTYKIPVAALNKLLTEGNQTKQHMEV